VAATNGKGCEKSRYRDLPSIEAQRLPGGDTATARGVRLNRLSGDACQNLLGLIRAGARGGGGVQRQVHGTMCRPDFCVCPLTPASPPTLSLSPRRSGNTSRPSLVSACTAGGAVVGYPWPRCPVRLVG
jgi:hypothetical protein